jgi:hypothetical protein
LQRKQKSTALLLAAPSVAMFVLVHRAKHILPRSSGAALLRYRSWRSSQPASVDDIVLIGDATGFVRREKQHNACNVVTVQISL